MIEIIIVCIGLFELSIFLIIETLWYLELRKKIPKPIPIKNQSYHYLTLGVKR